MVSMLVIAGGGLVFAAIAFWLGVRSASGGDDELWGAIGYLNSVFGVGAAVAGVVAFFERPSLAAAGDGAAIGGLVALGVAVLLLVFRHIHRRRQPEGHDGYAETDIRHYADSGMVVAAPIPVARNTGRLAAIAMVATPTLGSVAAAIFVTLQSASLELSNNISTAEAPAPASAPAPAPVYNAVADPNGGEPNILLDGTRTRLLFNIGSPNIQNMIASPELPRRLAEILNSMQTVDLTVTMTCNVCDDALPQTKHIRYSSEEKSSEIAEFPILPDYNVARQRRAETISFSIRQNNIELDFLNVPVRVQKGPDTTSSTRTYQCTPDITESENPDLVLELVRDYKTGLKLGIDAHDSALARRLAAYQLVDAQGEPRYFDTKAEEPEAVTQSAGEVYKNLKALVSTDAAAQKAFPDIKAARHDLAFDDKQQKQTVAELYGLGTYMYSKLFLTGDLRKIFHAIEQYGTEQNAKGKSPRVLIYTSAIYLPWQLLHAVQPDDSEPDAEQFWGNKYILSVIPESKERGCGRLPGAMQRPGKDEVLYAQYWQEDVSQDIAGAPKTSTPDYVSKLGENFGKALDGAFTGDVNTVREKPDFKKRLGADRRHLRILWTFTHGHSGDQFIEVKTSDGATASNRQDSNADTKSLPAITVILQEAAGQRLDFSRSSAITAIEIDKAMVQDEDPQFFVERPLVFLNGCETGTQGSRGTTELSLPGIFIAAGARGVVATEAEIWDAFGYGFAEMFLDKLTNGGMDAGSAMLATRRELLHDSNNPFGLLYSYYGNAAVRFVE